MQIYAVVWGRMNGRLAGSVDVVGLALCLCAENAKLIRRVPQLHAGDVWFGRVSDLHFGRPSVPVRAPIVVERSRASDKPVLLARSVRFGFGGCEMRLKSSSRSGESMESISSQ